MSDRKEEICLIEIMYSLDCYARRQTSKFTPPPY